MSSLYWLRRRLRLCRKGGRWGWRVHAAFTGGRGCIAGEERGVTGSCWVHYRLRLCRRGGRMAGRY